jgi:hypothetical protein
MNPRRAIFIFWSAAFTEVLALGVAWSAWKATAESSLAPLVAVPATLVGMAAAVVAGRILTVFTRASRRGTRTQAHQG